jgi:hypothetical protein
MAIKINGNAAELRAIVPARPYARQWLQFWDSPETFAAHVSTIDPAACWHDCAWNNDDNRGTRSMPAAIELARTGWPEGAARAAKLRDRINAANPIGPRMVRWDVAGAVPSVPRALAGNPLSMRRIDSARLRRRPVLTLLSDMTCHWGIAGETLTNRSAVVAAIVDAIESAGFSAHVVGLAGVHRDDLFAQCAVTLKEPEQPADIGRLAFGLGHASMFRRLMFAAYVENTFTKNLGSCLGFPAPLPSIDLPDNTYVLPSVQEAEREFRTEESAATAGLQCLLAALRKQNCPAFPAAE